MRIVRSIAAMQRWARQVKRTGVQTAFVPTMGYLHEGHLSLIRRARKLAGPRGQVVASIFVNPTQFSPDEDLARYPRDLPGDTELCRRAGVDVLFVPAETEMYSPEFSTYVVEERLSHVMEGASRPTHFRGVTTVVAKLFNIVQPDTAIFGAKDFQQAAIIQRMTRDLNFPVRIIVAPTMREPDGLALSSRNKYLSESERQQATVLWRCIRSVRRALKQRGPVLSALMEKKRLARLVSGEPAARLDYIEFFNPATLQPVRQVQKGAHVAMAVFIGKTRLIDNARL